MEYSKRISLGRIRKRETLIGFVFIAPILLFFFAVKLVPVLFAIYTSFHDWNGLSPMQFCGLWNYIDLVGDDYFRTAFLNTMVYAGTVVGGLTITGLLSALVINSLTRKLSTLMRVSYFVPPVLSVVAVSIFWRWILYQPTYGLFNTILIALGFPSQGFLSDPNQAMASIIVMTIWKWTGYHTIIFIAGLQMIPKTYYEAANIDSASGWKMFTKITLPLLKPALLFSMVINFISCFQIFDTVYIMTRGGPANTTTTVVYQMYDYAFGYMKFGYASTMGVTLFGVILLVTLMQMKIMRKGGIEAY